MTNEVQVLISRLQPLQQQGMTPLEAARTVLSAGDASFKVAAGAGHEVFLRSSLFMTQALVQVFGPLTPAELATILHATYPDLSAVDIGRNILDPAVFPNTSPDEMQNALLTAGFDAATVAAAIKVLYPAPQVRFAAIATSMQAGGRGIQFWSSGSSGQLWTISQQAPGTDWGPWQGPGFQSQPVPLRQLAAALQNNGNAMLAGLDDSGRVWTCGQGNPGGGWGGWQGPSVGGQPRAFQRLAASQQGGNRGIELWATGDDGQVWTLYQLSAGGGWSRWEGPGFKGQPTPLFKLAAAQQNNGNVLFWGLDGNGKLWGISQQWPGGDWGAWQGPGVGGQPEPFVEIAASEQKGSRGVEVWGVGASGQIWTLYQLTAGGAWGHWEGPGFKGQPVPMRKIAAALQDNGNVLLWGVDDADQLWMISQDWPGGDWGAWRQSSLPPKG